MQWEKGISLSKGEYIWIAESDDYCKPDFLEKMVSILDANPDASYVMSGSHLVDSLDNPIPYDLTSAHLSIKKMGVLISIFQLPISNISCYGIMRLIMPA